jgi:Tfp pilus assembly protein PilF
LQALGRLDEAVACFRHALDLDPRQPEAQNNLGNALLKQEHPDEASAGFRRALALRPDYPEAHNNLGNVLKEQGRLDEAVACYRRAVALKPDYAEALNNLGIVLQEQGLADEAIGCCRSALALKPDYPEAYENLGNALRAQQLLDDAIACYRKAIDLQPDAADTHANLAMALLAHGELGAGWEEYEWRWKTNRMIRSARPFLQPQWRGEPAEGRTLLIHAEQGFGDTLQFCRYAPLAAARGLRVILEVPGPLVRLLRSLPGVAQVVATGEALPPFDLQCPMLSLPLAMGTTTLAAIPGSVPYLHADAAQAAAWSARLAAMEKPGLRVGLVWAGSSRKDQPAAAAIDRRRSMAPDRLAPLFALPGLHFVSLQKDGPAAPAAFRLTDVMEAMGDFADTAALIAVLDLVISVDTAVAHLAAALGKPVWLLDRSDPCWRWLQGRRDSPWYPNLTLFRQPDAGNWDAVIETVREDLRRMSDPDTNWIEPHWRQEKAGSETQTHGVMAGHDARGGGHDTWVAGHDTWVAGHDTCGAGHDTWVAGHHTGERPSPPDF